MPSSSASVVCPLPTAVSYGKVKAAYDKARKAMPQLTPAAWRKAAAQDLGMPYDAYLAIWKTKGKVPMVPVSTATHPVSAVGGQIPTTAAIPGTETMKYANDLKQEYEVLFESWKLGSIEEDELYDAIDELGLNLANQFPGVPATYQTKLTNKLINDIADIQAKKAAPKGTSLAAAKKAVAAAKKVPSSPKKYSPPPFVVPPAPAVSGLTYDAAQAAYKLMKQQMPGGTPAQWRHAAAKHLGIDYNDYLKAWKNKPGAGPKPVPKMGAPSTTAPTASSAASGTNVIPLSPSSVGKYAKAQNLSVDQVKDELARLFGPSAKKEYISPTYNEATGMYTVDFPVSILTKQGMADVAEGLKKLGLKVEKLPGGNDNKYKIGPANYKPPPPEAKFKKVDGKNVLNLNQAQKDTDGWWDTLSKAEKDSWNTYTGSGYTGINRALRGLDSMTSTIRAHTANLNGSMAKVEENFTVWRGGSYDVDLFKKGGKFHAENFTSTAVNTGGGFGGNVRFEITVSKGTKGKFVGKKSRHPGENEFLIESGMDYRVTEVEILSNGNAIVKMTSIPKK